LSIIVEFFAATSQEAPAAPESGPGLGWPGFSCGNFDAYEALLGWEAAVTERPWRALLDAGVPTLVAGDEARPMVVQASDTLRAWLAGASAHEIAWLTDTWGPRAGVHPEAGVDILTSLAELALETGGSSGIYCWVA
jgi:hypothetical protein